MSWFKREAKYIVFRIMPAIRSTPSYTQFLTISIVDGSFHWGALPDQATQMDLPIAGEIVNRLNPSSRNALARTGTAEDGYYYRAAKAR